MKRILFILLGTLFTLSISALPQLTVLRASIGVLTKDQNDPNLYHLVLQKTRKNSVSYDNNQKSYPSSQSQVEEWSHSNGLLYAALALPSAYGVRYELLKLNNPHQTEDNQYEFLVSKPNKVKYYLTGKFYDVALLVYPDPCNVTCQYGIRFPQWSNKCWPGNICQTTSANANLSKTNPNQHSMTHQDFYKIR